MEAHKLDPFTGEDEIGGFPGGGGAYAGTVEAAVEERPAVKRDPRDPTTWGKVGRNEECPCGSGKKFKHCHGRYV